MDTNEFVKKIIKANIEDHNINFWTITFKDMWYEPEPQAYKAPFVKIKFNLENQLNNQYSKKRKAKKPYSKVGMILWPEWSGISTIPRHYRPYHYHGFLMYPKICEDRFKNRCIKTGTFPDANGRLNFELSENILNSYQPNDKEDRAYLIPFSDKLIPIIDEGFQDINSQIEACVSYSSKRKYDSDYFQKPGYFIL